MLISTIIFAFLRNIKSNAKITDSYALNKLCDDEIESQKNAIKVNDAKLNKCSSDFETEKNCHNLYRSMKNDKVLQNYNEKDGLYRPAKGFDCENYVGDDKIPMKNGCLFSSSQGVAKYCNLQGDCMGFTMSGSGEFAPLKEIIPSKYGGTVFEKVK